MKDEDIAPNTYRTADPVGMGKKVAPDTQYSSIVYRHDILPIPTGSAECIWCNILVFHFASYSIYNLLFHAIHR